MDFLERMLLLNGLILDYFVVNDKDSIKASDLMPYLIDKGFYAYDHREGLPLRNDLRKLDELNKLDIIETLNVERGARNRKWTFINPKAR